MFLGTGSQSNDNVFAVDGVVITDMAAIGASPTYYNFDAFEELQMTTGGSDASLATGGVTLNLVTKRGTNEWRGSGRYIRADDALDFIVSDGLGTELPTDDPGAGAFDFAPSVTSSNATDLFSESFSPELGGFILKDRLWFFEVARDGSVTSPSFTSSVNSTLEGLAAETKATTSTLSGDSIDIDSFANELIFADGFESGDTSAWRN